MGLPIFLDYAKKPVKVTSASSKRQAAEAFSPDRSSIRRRPSIHRGSFPRPPTRNYFPPSPLHDDQESSIPGASEAIESRLRALRRSIRGGRRHERWVTLPTPPSERASASGDGQSSAAAASSAPAIAIQPTNGLGDRVRSPSPMDPVVSAWDAARANLDTSLEAADSAIAASFLADHMTVASAHHQAGFDSFMECLSDGGESESSGEPSRPSAWPQESRPGGDPTIHVAEPSTRTISADPTRYDPLIRIRSNQATENTRRFFSSHRASPLRSWHDPTLAPDATESASAQVDSPLSFIRSPPPETARRSADEAAEDFELARPFLERLSRHPSNEIPDDWWRSVGLRAPRRHQR